MGSQTIRHRGGSLDGFGRGSLSRELGEVCGLIWTAQPLRSRKFTPILCCILDNHKNEFTFEAAVDGLMGIRDPSSVPALVRAVEYHQDSDDGFHINEKILNTLFAIRNDEAIEG